MTKSIYTANRLREVLLSGHWIANTNYKEQLLATTWEVAVHKIGTSNTIAALTFHVNYYLAGLLHVFKRGRLEIRDEYSFDLAPILSHTDWNALVGDFLSNAEEFAAFVEQLTESKVDEPFVDEKYGTYLRNIDGVIEHCYYHLGQISLLRKLIAEKAQVHIEIN